ncbi:putative toxin-antitoxin system toxin component, PIN family [Candidatus Albibeggiatoa sp. nov. BB20]|uniref:putative toxin-antitoxin system toxin component, PIN family n=1 Tax=Candidatus Albibeggiatoa sp. nov. BB20 TaxID=3162723 RepID=UPI003365A0ED
MITLVIDTSVLISALIGKHGASRKILKQALQKKFKPLISNTLFSEYQDVSQRDTILARSPLTTEEIQALLNALYNVCDWIPIYYLWRPNLIDDDDNFLIELALAGNADYIITHNLKDLQNAELHFPNIHIVTPEDFLKGQ